MKWSDVRFTFFGKPVWLRASRSPETGRLCLEVVDGFGRDPIGVLTVDVPGSSLGSDEVVARLGSETMFLAGKAFRSGVFEDTGRRVVTAVGREFPVWRITEESLLVGGVG